MTDYSLTTFGESGELTQVRHALTAVGNGETVIGIRAKNGIVIAAEKKLASQLYVSDQKAGLIYLMKPPMGCSLKCNIIQPFD